MLLIVDKRERYCASFVEDEIADANMKNVKYELDFQFEQISKGDFVLCDKGKILMCIERKTLEDLADSITGGRYDNKDKMMKLRADTGCKLVLLIESPHEFVEPGKRFGRIPYKYLEAAINHMMIRDGFYIVRSRDPLDSVRKIINFMITYKSVEIKGDVIADFVVDDAVGGSGAIATSADASATSADASAASARELTNADVVTTLTDTNEEADIETADLKDLKTIVEKSPNEVLRRCWAALRGISVISAQVIIKNNVYEYLSGVALFKDLKMQTGHKMGAPAIASYEKLAKFDKPTWKSFLSGITGISEATAEKILTNITSPDDFKDIKKISEIPTSTRVSAKGAVKNLMIGQAKANKILSILNQKLD